MTDQKEIGGYIEFEHFRLPMLHEDAVKLNCGRNALAYLIETKNIKKILFPKFMCDSCEKIFNKYQVEVRRYSIGKDFKPLDMEINENEWLYLVNYYGQLSNGYVSDIKNRYKRVIVDNAQGYFEDPVSGVDTIYICRKFFGVSDGALLYTDRLLDRELEIDESFNRMNFLLGRFERTASEFYSEYVNNNALFEDEPIKKMSRLTENLLHSLDYQRIKEIRTQNFEHLHNELKSINKLDLCVPEGAFMYPLYVSNGYEIRKKLQSHKIYIPVLWPSVFNFAFHDDIEYDMANNILPLPIDQRYSYSQMQIIIQEVIKCIG